MSLTVKNAKKWDHVSNNRSSISLMKEREREKDRDRDRDRIRERERNIPYKWKSFCN